MTIGRDRIYWANHGADKLSWASLEGTGGGDIDTTGVAVDEPVGLAVDDSSGLETLYWANDGGGGAGSIGFARQEPPDGNYEGAYLNTTGATVDKPSGLAIDPADRDIYWANSGANEDHEYKISFAGLGDNGGGGDLKTSAMVERPGGVALDPEADRIYWVNQAGDNISYMNLSGGGAGEIRALGAPSDGPAFLALMEAPVSEAMLGPFIFWGGEERTPPVGKMLNCNPTGPAWAPDLPGAFLFRAPAELTMSWQFNGIEIPGRSSSPPVFSSLTPTEPGIYSCLMTAVNAAGTSFQGSQQVQVVPAPPVAVTPAAPVLADLTETHRTLAPGRASTALTGRTSRHAARGTTFSFALNVGAAVSVQIERARAGRRDGAVCRLSENRRAHGGRACIAYTRVATLTRTGHPGINRTVFTGRIRGRALAPGDYRAVFTARDLAGTSRAAAIGFTVVLP